jgi:hypothetical protein
MLSCGVWVTTTAAALGVGFVDPVAEVDGKLEEDAPVCWDLSEISTPASATATTRVAATPSTDARRAGPRPDGKPGEKRFLEPLLWRVTSPA